MQVKNDVRVDREGKKFGPKSVEFKISAQIARRFTQGCPHDAVVCARIVPEFSFEARDDGAGKCPGNCG